MDEPEHRPLVSAEELLARMDEPSLRVADVRWFIGEPGRGRAEYDEGHIRGAVFVDLDRDLAAASGPGRHPLPDPSGFAARMGELGFGDGHSIVVHDAHDGRNAARLWWMLDRLGYRDVAVLDGGLDAWRAAGGDLTAVASTPLRATLTLSHEWRGTIDREELVAREGEVDIVDVRSVERYRGEFEPYDRIAGHIPGARSRPCDALVDETGRLLPPERLGVIMRSHAAAADKPTVVSCGSGVNACFGALALRIAGMADPLLYPGSYSDWVAGGMPVARGDEPYEVGDA